MVKELQRKQRLKGLVYSYPSIILLGVVTFFLVKGAVGIMQIERENAGKVKALEMQAVDLRLHESDLKAEIERLKTEEGIVEEIKKKFSATRDGEHVAIIVESRAKATSTEDSDAAWFKKAWASIQGLWSR